MLNRCGDGCEHHVRAPADKFNQGRAATLVLDVLKVSARHLAKQFTRQMVRGTDPARRAIQPAGFGLGQRDQFLH